MVLCSGLMFFVEVYTTGKTVRSIMINHSFKGNK